MTFNPEAGGSAMAVLRSRDAAQAALQMAMRGETDTALDVLISLADAGDDSLYAPIAELFAFRGRWIDAALWAGRRLAGTVSLDDVTLNLIGIVVRAGQVTNDWPHIVDISRSGLAGIAQLSQKLGNHGLNGMRLKTLIASITADAPPEGYLKPIHPVNVFATPGSSNHFESAMAQLKNVGFDFEKNQRQVLAIAINCNSTSDIIRLYESGVEVTMWRDILAISRAYAAMSVEKAWDVIAGHAQVWWPGNEGIAAPINLLVEEPFVQMMTPERCSFIVDNPRGPAARPSGETTMAKRWFTAPTGRSRQPAVAEWEDLLVEFSQQFLSNDLKHGPFEPTELHETGYLGRPGASEDEVREAELRLGHALPPSYCAFMKASNGWHDMGASFPGEMWPVAEIKTFAEAVRGSLDDYKECLQYEIEDYLEELKERTGRAISARQILSNSIQITDWGDACVLMLSPDIIAEDGEWLCLEYASWNPGFDIFANFGAWFKGRFENL